MSQEIIDKIKQAIEGYKDNTEWEEIGKVVEVGDGILKISGLTNVQSQEVLVVETDKKNVKAVALNLEKDAPNIVNRESVNYPLHSGIKAIDSMIPIGRGQRELIIGDRQTGKTAIALDIIIN